MNIIEENTLYYYFSTIAQVLAATTALVFIALQFRLNDIKRYLIGDGQATYERAKSKDKTYNALSYKDIGRLRDSLGREDLDGIEEILKVLHDSEEKDGFTENERPTGFQYLYNRFVRMRTGLLELRKLIREAVLFSIITIILSIISISLIDIIDEFLIIEIAIMLTTLGLTIWSLWKTYQGIMLGLK